jgi:hypothetical protein
MFLLILIFTICDDTREDDASGLSNSKLSPNLSTVRASFVSEMCGHKAAT